MNGDAASRRCFYPLAGLRQVRGEPSSLPDSPRLKL
jgi:hypothetical protein